jgi:hypothetical protein
LVVCVCVCTTTLPTIYTFPGGSRPQSEKKKRYKLNRYSM